MRRAVDHQARQLTSRMLSDREVSSEDGYFQIKVLKQFQITLETQNQRHDISKQETSPNHAEGCSQIQVNKFSFLFPLFFYQLHSLFSSHLVRKFLFSDYHYILMNIICYSWQKLIFADLFCFCTFQKFNYFTRYISTSFFL